jgi:porin
LKADQYNVNWDLKSNDGVLVFSELQFATNFGNMPGTLKAGYYFHSHLKETCPETKITETVFDKNYGFYAVADQRIYQFSENRVLGLFAQLAVSPTNINSHNYYLGGGINYTGIFDNEGEDAVGIAFAHAGFRDSSLKNETTIEMFYRVSITENLFAQPDFQYIINPAGTESNLNNALAFFMRFGINF